MKTSFKMTIEVELQPFTVPNFVLTVPKPGKREDGMQEAQKYALADLDPVTLECLCDKFRDEVFVKAGKYRPPQPA